MACKIVNFEVARMSVDDIIPRRGRARRHPHDVILPKHVYLDAGKLLKILREVLWMLTVISLLKAPCSFEYFQNHSLLCARWLLMQSICWKMQRPDQVQKAGWFPWTFEWWCRTILMIRNIDPVLLSPPQIPAGLKGFLGIPEDSWGFLQDYTIILVILSWRRKILSSPQESWGLYNI